MWRARVSTDGGRARRHAVSRSSEEQRGRVRTARDVDDAPPAEDVLRHLSELPRLARRLGQAERRALAVRVERATVGPHHE
eukprot:3826547-Prymnesium_polylepis.2